MHQALAGKGPFWRLWALPRTGGAPDACAAKALCCLRSLADLFPCPCALYYAGVMAAASEECGLLPQAAHRPDRGDAVGGSHFHRHHLHHPLLARSGAAGSTHEAGQCVSRVATSPWHGSNAPADLLWNSAWRSQLSGLPHCSRPNCSATAVAVAACRSCRASWLRRRAPTWWWTARRTASCCASTSTSPSRRRVLRTLSPGRASCAGLLLLLRRRVAAAADDTRPALQAPAPAWPWAGASARAVHAQHCLAVALY